MNTTPDDENVIAQLNDAFRSNFISSGICGKIVMTHGISLFSQEEKEAIFKKVQSFSDFTKDNDPYGEHDFGSFTFEGKKICWKIDYYDPECNYGSEDPADPLKTCRVLTILLAEEW